MKTVCRKCKKEFFIHDPVALAYMLNNEEYICNSCSFKNVLNSLKRGFDLDLHDKHGKVKSMQNLLEELSMEFKKIN